MGLAQGLVTPLAVSPQLALRCKVKQNLALLKSPDRFLVLLCQSSGRMMAGMFSVF